MIIGSEMSGRYSGYENITLDGGVRKKVLQKGFGKMFPSEGMEMNVNFVSELEDGRMIDNTYVTREPLVFVLGGTSVVPGLEMALKTMKMGEKASVVVGPEYSFLSLDKLKLEKIENSEEKEKKISELEEKWAKLKAISPEELTQMEPKDAKYFSTVKFEIEIIKFDKPRKHKSMMEPEERIEEAANLKNEGNELFREKRYMEAMVKYNTGLHYLQQMPTEFLTQKVIDLRVQLCLNITNCHICLTEYNYALKKVEEAFSIKNPSPVKCHYFRCIALMNLGEFQKAGEDYKVLKAMLPNDPLVKQLQNDFEKIKEKTISAKKGMIKKGLLSSHLYEEKVIEQKKTLLPPLIGEKSKQFYIDFIVNKNAKDPKKIKIELFRHTIEKIPDIFSYIDEKIRNKEIKSMEVIDKSIVLLNIGNDVLVNKQVQVNLYPPCQPYLLVLKKAEISTLELTLEKVSDMIVDNIIVLGRVYFNADCLKQISPGNEVQITDCDYSFNLI